MKITAKWIGLKEANAALKRLPEHVKPGVQQVIDVTAFQIARGAEARAPFRQPANVRSGPNRGGGLLKRSIQWRSRPRSLSAVVGVLGDAFYYYFLEYGTVKMQARPFIRPAAEAMQGDHELRMLQVLERAKTKMEHEGSVGG